MKNKKPRRELLMFSDLTQTKLLRAFRPYSDVFNFVFKIES